MYYVIISNNMGAVGGQSPLSAQDALEKMEQAVSKGDSVSCKNENGESVSISQLREAR